MNLRNFNVWHTLQTVAMSVSGYATYMATTDPVHAAGWGVVSGVSTLILYVVGLVNGSAVAAPTTPSAPLKV